MMPMKLFALLLSVAGLFAVSGQAAAQQSQDFGEYVVHYNALNANLIPPEVARAYDIQRSPSRALLNVTILKKVMDTPGSPVEADVSARGTNLIGQRRTIELREIREPGGAIYYIGELPIHNMETYNFHIELNVDGEPEPLVVRFRQQFYTE
jgi:hypothetical protein